MVRDKKLTEARDLFRQAMTDSPWDSESWNSALDEMGKLNVSLIFAPGQTADSKTYTVSKGDNLTNIGIKLNTTQGLLVRANGLSETTQLSLGQSLKYTPKDFRIVVERSKCRLFLYEKDGLFKRYYVGLGMPGHETVLGKYTIGNKQKDPVWHKPGGVPIAAGDPANELGTRWMPLVPAEPGLPTDLGIHGTIAPETIGQYKSHGCPRMRKEDVEELYDLIVRSTPVEIVDTIEPAKTS
jgi:lipoprotein-anchoring transpeptidase ErfK/SrfK